jgi:hypothetical protein
MRDIKREKYRDLQTKKQLKNETNKPKERKRKQIHPIPPFSRRRSLMQKKIEVNPQDSNL